MTGKKKTNGSPAGKRRAALALSLCLLAGVTMFGMYTVEKTEEQQKKLEQEMADAEKAVKARQQELAEAKAAREQKEAETKARSERQAASGTASRDRSGEEEASTQKAGLAEEAELEGEYAEIALDGPVVIEEADAGAEAPPLSFSAETDKLLWPIAGNILVDYSMDKTVYFPTLDQYKYSPAMIIEGTPDQSVLSAAVGKVTSIENLDETGTTLTMDIGNGYEVIYGQLKDPVVQQGDYVQTGDLIGYLAEPTRFYSKEGCNLYFQVKKDGESVNPKELLS